MYIEVLLCVVSCRYYFNFDGDEPKWLWFFRFTHRTIFDIVFVGQTYFVEKVATVECDDFHFQRIWNEGAKGKEHLNLKTFTFSTTFSN